MSATGEAFYEFLKGNINNLDFIDFLNRAIEKLRMRYKSKKVIIIADNVRMHKTAYFKSFCIYNDITLLYTVANNPTLNPIEYLFRYLKTDLRKVHTCL